MKYIIVSDNNSINILDYHICKGINITTENKKTINRKNNKEKSIDREKDNNKDKDKDKDKEKDKEKDKTATEKSLLFGLHPPDRYFLISDSLDCNLCLFDIDNKFKLLLKQKIHKMGIKSLIQVSDNLYISYSIDKTIYFWNLSITQEIAEEPESKDKKKKKKEETKEKENKEKEEALTRIIVTLNCIGEINDLKWLTNTVLFYPFKRTVYVGSQDKTIKIYRILNYNEYQNDNKTTLIFKNVGSLKGHNRDVTLIKALGDEIISAGNDFILKIWKDN